MPSSTRWRIYVTRVGSNPPSIGEIKMASSVGGANLCVGGTASASSVFDPGYVAANAFDGTTTNIWAASGGPPAWVEYTFPSAVDIIEVRLFCRWTSPDTQMARDCRLEYHDGSSWVPRMYMSAQEYWLTGEQKIFRILAEPSVGEYFYWRVRETAAAAASLRLAEISMAVAWGGADLTDAGMAGGVAFGPLATAPSTLPPKAFDDNTSTKYEVHSSVGLGAGFIGFVFNTPRRIREVKIKAPSGGTDYLGCFKAFVIEASNTGLSGDWTTLYTNAGPLSWTAGQERTFQFDAVVFEGDLTVTEDDDTLDGRAEIAFIGALAVTEADDDLAADGSVAVSAALSVTHDDDALASYGQSGPGVVGGLGDLSITEDDDALVATAAVDVVGDLAITEDGDALAAFALFGTNGPFAQRPLLVLN